MTTEMTRRRPSRRLPRTAPWATAATRCYIICPATACTVIHLQLLKPIIPPCPPCPSPFPGRPRQLRALLKANPRALFYADGRYVALRAFCTDATHGLALSPDEFCHVTCAFPRTPRSLPSPLPTSLLP